MADGHEMMDASLAGGWAAAYPPEAWHAEPDVLLYQGDANALLKGLPDGAVDCVVTSPPYYNLRDYSGGEDEMGREETAQGYIDAMVALFHEVRRVLADDGTLWLNIGDTYSKGGRGDLAPAKSLNGIPWRVAMGMTDDGWILRAENIWHKTRTLPDGATDRPSKAHEHVFMFTKTERSTYNLDDIRVPLAPSSVKRLAADIEHERGTYRANGGSAKPLKPVGNSAGRNIRDVWPICPSNSRGAHFATFPLELPTLCIKAGCRHGGVVLDPFSGSATTGVAALNTGRRYVGLELNPDYIDLSINKLHGYESSWNDETAPDRDDKAGSSTNLFSMLGTGEAGTGKDRPESAGPGSGEGPGF